MTHLSVDESYPIKFFIYFKKEGVLRKLTFEKKTLKVVFQFFLPVPLYLTSHMVQNNPSFFFDYMKNAYVCASHAQRDDDQPK